MSISFGGQKRKIVIIFKKFLDSFLNKHWNCKYRKLYLYLLGGKSVNSLEEEIESKNEFESQKRYYSKTICTLWSLVIVLYI